MRTRPIPTRRFLMALLAAMVLLAACGGGDDDGGGGEASGGDDSEETGEDGEQAAATCPVDALDDADGPVEIEIWQAFSAETKETFEALVAEFNDSQDRVEVVNQSQGTSYDEVLRKYVAGIPSGDLPSVAYLEDVSLKEVVDSGTVLPAEACEQASAFETGQLPVVRDYYTVDGTYWPGYVNVSEPILYYNGTHLRSAGLDPAESPQTLDELRTMAEALKEDGVPSPLALILNRWFIESWITGAGESVVNNGNGRDDTATESTFDNPVTHEIYEWIKGMADDGLLAGFSATSGQINQYLAVAQQNSSMVLETSTAATAIKAVLGGVTYDDAEGLDVGEIDPSVIDVRAGPFPGVEEPSQVRVSGGAFMMTNTGTPEEQAAAWEFMRWMWEVPQQVTWHLQGSYLPTTQVVANDPAVQEYWETDLAGKLLKVSYDQLVQVDSTNQAPLIGPYTDYTEAIKTSLDRLVLEGASVDDVIATADEEIQAALDEYIEANGG
jgi:sn-glycerol 3-phosphate transport system substrate-binding protein